MLVIFQLSFKLGNSLLEKGGVVLYTTYLNLHKKWFSD